MVYDSRLSGTSPGVRLYDPDPTNLILSNNTASRRGAAVTVNKENNDFRRTDCKKNPRLTVTEPAPNFMRIFSMQMPNSLGYHRAALLPLAFLFNRKTFRPSLIPLIGILVLLAIRCSPEKGSQDEIHYDGGMSPPEQPDAPGPCLTQLLGQSLKCDGDEDGDKIANADDACVFEAGPELTSGCPIEGARLVSWNKRDLPNGQSVQSVVSRDGRYVAFISGSTNIVSATVEGDFDLLFKDMATGEAKRIRRVGRDPFTIRPVLSDITPDGRYVVFSAMDGIDVSMDVYLYANDTETTETISRRDLIAQAGYPEGGFNFALNPTISADGRFIAFQVQRSFPLPEGMGSGSETRRHIALYDRSLEEMRLLSVNSQGELANGGCGEPSMSTDGRYVVFSCDATNLATGGFGVYLYNVETRTLERIIRGRDPSLSGDGRFIAFRDNPAEKPYCDLGYVFDLAGGRAEVITPNEEGSCSFYPNRDSMSDDGRFVAFDGAYVVDRNDGSLVKVSLNGAGIAAGNDEVSLSGNGQFLTFTSKGSDSHILFPGLNGQQIFIVGLETFFEFEK